MRAGQGLRFLRRLPAVRPGASPDKIVSLPRNLLPRPSDTEGMNPAMSQERPPAPAAPAAAPDVPAGAEPSPELVAFVTSRALFERLAGYVRKRRVPARCVEEVVQDTLASAWRSRHAWPTTTEQLLPWMYFVANARVVDFFRERDDMEHAFGKKDSIGGQAPRATPLEAHEALQWAREHAADRPGVLRALGWVSRHLMGHSYAEMAEKDGVTEQTIKSAISALRQEMREAFGKDNVNAVLAAFLVLLGIFLAWRHHEEAKRPPPAPPTVPTIVAPPAPVPQAPPQGKAEPSAREIRAAAMRACEQRRWSECYEGLERAAEIDPDGAKDPRVKAAYARAARGLSAKP